MKVAQEQELLTVESAQRAQFAEFSKAWDEYMTDYETTAYLSLEKMKVPFYSTTCTRKKIHISTGKALDRDRVAA